MKLINGKKIADKILKRLKRNIQKEKIKPHLAVVLIGKKRTSELYVQIKSRAAERIGLWMSLFRFESSVQEREVVKLIKKLNRDKKINGILVQLPLPRGLTTEKIIFAINPQKDADGFHPQNIKNFLQGQDYVEPAFPRAVIKLIESTGLPLNQKNAVIVANSRTFGTMMLEALKRKKINSLILLSSDLNEKNELLKKADIVVTAIGKPGIITGAMIKKGAVVIDGGIIRKKGKTLGDVDFDSVSSRAAYLSPVPGGVGPVTVACLLENVNKLALAQKKSKSL